MADSEIDDPAGAAHPSQPEKPAGDGKSSTPADDPKPVSVIPPPLPQGAQPPSLSLAVATQILTQPGGFHDLPVEVQRQFVEGVNQLDKYNHEQACKTLERDERIHNLELADEKTKRWQVLLVFGVIAALAALLCWSLVSHGDRNAAVLIFNSGLQIALGVLGGIGIARGFGKHK
jgi:hypothetical protein